MEQFFKRLITSFFLISILALAFYYTFFLVILLILVVIISWVEFNGLIKRIFNQDKLKDSILEFFFKSIALLYLVFFAAIIYQEFNEFKLGIFYLFCVCICCDSGGYIFGKVFKGKKLTKISPNKTVSGAIGSFTLSLLLVPLFMGMLTENINEILNLILITFLVSSVCQAGDLFISYLKRTANVKDTGDVLPGHGGILDRIDGIIFAIPFGILLWKFLQ